MTDGATPPALYEARKKVHPKAVFGFFRTLKWRIMVVTLAIYYVTPWIRWDRGEGQPDQAVLVDLANRRFHVFFIEIWPQEFFYVAALLVMAGVGLFLVTSVLGRAWCGYLCPQTVWTDLFVHVERAIEGDRNARIRLDRQGWDAEKWRKRVLKHSIWLAIALLTGGAWVFYFADAPTLMRELLTGQAAPVAYTAIALLTFTTYWLGGHMREQVCIYMCPWPRIQAAMLDERSLTVTYNDWQGEPRGRGKRRELLGDCIDCNACVAVCPTGVDIRNGQQIGCITCGLCIDACNRMLEKVDLPRLLVSYSTLEDTEARRVPDLGAAIRHAALRPRTLIYGLVWAGIGLALVAALALRDRLDVAVEHDRNLPFVILSDGSIHNAFTVRIANMRPEARLFEVTLDGLPGGVLSEAGGDADDALRIAAPADAVHETRLFVTLPRGARDGARFAFALRDLSGTDTARSDAAFLAPDGGPTR